MRKALRDLVLNLPGPTSSYCACNKSCSAIEMDHVLPKKFLKQHISDKGKLTLALKDPHNLYRCCSIKNRKKGHQLLKDKDVGNDFSGMMARSYLYMFWRYKIKPDAKLKSTVECMNTIHTPFKFERERDEKIRIFNGQRNPFIYNYPDLKDKY